MLIGRMYADHYPTINKRQNDNLETLEYFTQQGWKSAEIYNEIFKQFYEYKTTSPIAGFRVIRALASIQLNADDVLQDSFKNLINSKIFNGYNIGQKRLAQILGYASLFKL